VCADRRWKQGYVDVVTEQKKWMMVDMKAPYLGPGVGQRTRRLMLESIGGQKVKVKFTLEQPMKIQKGDRGIALLFL
jgi:hypothetical protein